MQPLDDSLKNESIPKWSSLRIEGFLVGIDISLSATSSKTGMQS